MRAMARSCDGIYKVYLLLYQMRHNTQEFGKITEPESTLYAAEVANSHTFWIFVSLFLEIWGSLSLYSTFFFEITANEMC